jgi:ATP-binding cassette subfamily G (WHITE) protein 2 (PDR)
MFNSIQTLVEISSQFAQRPIVVCTHTPLVTSVIDYFKEKQSGFAMYHPGIDAISSLISLYPLKLLGVSLFNIILYFLAGLKREAGPFFIFMLFTYTMVLIMASIFRVIGALNKHEAIATSIGGVFVLPLIVYTGCELFISNVEGSREVTDSV